METRTMRKATLVGGIATGALLFAGTAAQAADIETEEAGLDAVQAAPEMLGGLPIPVDAVPGLNAVLPVQELPAPATDAKDKNVKNGQQQPATSPISPVGDLLGNLGGGLPVPLPF